MSDQGVRLHLKADAGEHKKVSKVSVVTLRNLKQRGTKAVCVTAYDYPTAVFADRAGVDVVLVGDSAAMTVLGLPNTLGIGMDEMLVFARAVARGAKRAFVIGDLPFLSYQVSNEDAIRNAGAFIAAGCDAVKLEGGARVANRMRAITDAGIAAMGHLGLTPQALGQQGGYRVQGKTRAAAERIVEDARALEEAGAFAILLEAVPPESASYIREQLTIPVYGIGAGPNLDGQLVISHDLLGNFVGDITPRFVSRLASLDAVVTQAFGQYAAEVRGGAFPAPRHCYAPDAGERNANPDPLLELPTPAGNDRPLRHTL
jgi:3-methyl-2-oxobutanoate hydroxymethyltransferase